jgi:hypothetical protein
MTCILGNVYRPSGGLKDSHSIGKSFRNCCWRPSIDLIMGLASTELQCYDTDLPQVLEF